MNYIKDIKINFKIGLILFIHSKCMLNLLISNILSEWIQIQYFNSQFES